MQRRLITKGQEYYVSDRQKWQSATSLPSDSRVRVIDTRPWHLGTYWGAYGSTTFTVEDGRTFRGTTHLRTPDDLSSGRGPQINAVIVENLDTDTGEPTGKIRPVLTSRIRDTWEQGSSLIRRNEAKYLADSNAHQRQQRILAARMHRVGSVLPSAVLDHTWSWHRESVPIDESQIKVRVTLFDLERMLAEHIPGWQPYTDGEEPR